MCRLNKNIGVNLCISITVRCFYRLLNLEKLLKVTFHIRANSRPRGLTANTKKNKRCKKSSSRGEFLTIAKTTSVELQV